MRRFSANKSKARQATSRLRQIDKIKIEDFKPSSRQNPYIRFEGEKKLHRLAFESEQLKKRYERTLFENFDLAVEAGERIAVVGANGAGKTTLVSILGGALPPDRGSVKWAENADVGIMPQDPSAEFDSDLTLTDWMSQWAKPGDDDQVIRGILGRLLFSGDDVKKPVRVLSGGEKGRMMFGKLMLGRHNVLLLDEPTNHMDMESIESLNIALEKYAGTLLFVSHGPGIRQFARIARHRNQARRHRRLRRAVRGIPHFSGNRRLMLGRVLRGLFFTLLFLIALSLGSVVVYRSLAAPKISGTLAVAGLKGTVDVVRDKDGVPHIFATEASDAWFSLGYVHAQDRLWQMMFNRRIAAGRLAEILGPSALPTDRYLRTLGVHANAEAQWQQQDAMTKGALQRYADGVNAYLAQRKGPLPPEFILTRRTST